MLLRQSHNRLSRRVPARDLFEQFHFLPPVHPGILSSGAVQVGQMRCAKWAKSNARTHVHPANQNHGTDDELETYSLERPQLGTKRAEIKEHLLICEL